jgi:hypothetical protein
MTHHAPNKHTKLITTLTILLALTGMAMTTSLSSDDAPTATVAPGQDDIEAMDFTITDGEDSVNKQGSTNDLNAGDTLTSFDSDDDVYTDTSKNDIDLSSANIWKETDEGNAKVYNENGQLVGGSSASTSSNAFDAQFDVNVDGGGMTTVTLENIDDSSAGIAQRAQSTLGIEGTSNSPAQGQIIDIDGSSYIIESVGSSQTDTVKVIGETSKSASNVKGKTGNVQDDTTISSQVNSVNVFGDQSITASGTLTANIDNSNRGTKSLDVSTSSDGSPNKGDLLQIGSGSYAVLDQDYSAAQPSTIPIVGDPAESFSNSEAIQSTSFSSSGTNIGSVNGNQDTGSDNTITLEASSTFSTGVSQGDILVIDSGTDASSSAEDVVIAVSSATTSDKTVEVAGASSTTLDDGHNILLSPTVSTGSHIASDWAVNTNQGISDGSADTSGLSGGTVVAIDDNQDVTDGATYAVVDGSSSFSGTETTLKILGSSSDSISDDDKISTVSLATSGSNPTVDLDDFDLESGRQIASAMGDAISGASVTFDATGYSSTQYKIDSDSTGSSSSIAVDDTSGSGSNIADSLNIDSETDNNVMSTAGPDTAIVDNSLTDDSTTADHELSSSDDTTFYDQDTDSSNTGNGAWDSGEDLVTDEDENGVFQDVLKGLTVKNSVSGVDDTHLENGNLQLWKSSDGTVDRGSDTLVADLTWNSGKWDVSGLSQEITSNTDYLISFNVSDSYSAGTKDLKAKITSAINLDSGDTPTVTNANKQTLDDSVKPQISTATINDMDVDGKTDQINLTMDVPVDDSASTLTTNAFSADSGFSVDGANTGQTADDNKLVLEVSGVSDTSTTPSITMETGKAGVDIKNLAGNTRGTDQLKAATDQAPPVLLHAENVPSSSTSSATHVKYTFSEKIKDTGNDGGQNEVIVDGNKKDLVGTNTLSGPSFTINMGSVINTGDEPKVFVDTSKGIEDANGNKPVNMSGSAVDVDSFRTTLANEWNYVSFPIADSTSPKISDVLDTSNVDVVWTYSTNGWESYDPDKSNNDLTTVSAGQGYLVNTTGSHTIAPNVNNEVSNQGAQASAPGDFTLQEGWNLVGQFQEFNQDADAGSSGGLNSVGSSNFDTVYRQNNKGSLAGITDVSGSPSNEMKTGEAFWVQTTGDLSGGTIAYTEN